MSANLGSREALVRLVHGKDDGEIYDELAAFGLQRALDQIFDGMARAFVPERAGAARGIVQWDIGTPRGTVSYQLVIADGRCEAVAGGPDAPRVRFFALLADFVRIVAGERDPMQAYFQRTLAASGDLWFGQQQRAWFEPA
jgi:hypothetical protein